MSPSLEKMHYELLINTVPDLWARFAYPSLAPLATWVQVDVFVISLFLMCLWYYHNYFLLLQVLFIIIIIIIIIIIVILVLLLLLYYYYY